MAPFELQPDQSSSQKRVAIIGSGISGLSAAWLLDKTFDVTVFEINDYVGGHSHTVDVVVNGVEFPVDTGFIVFNPPNYPNLSALFEALNVETVKTDMSFSVSMDDGGFEYSGGDNAGLLAQPANLFRPKFWSMIRGILKFYKETPEFLSDPSIDDLTLGELLEGRGYSRHFIQYHLAPMGAAIWSSDSVDILDFPARAFLKFFSNHGLTQISDRPEWRTVVKGSREYVKKITSSLKREVHLNSQIKAVQRSKDSIILKFADGTQEFDEVIFACHSDQAINLIESPSHIQQAVFSNLKYRANSVILHTDISHLPKRQKAWASWNYIEHPDGEQGDPAISYWMNLLQPLPVETPVIVTLNPTREIDPATILGKYEYEHPVMDTMAMQARSKVWDLQGQQNMWFCGAYLGDGFHEDGIQSGLAVAEMLCGIRRPWQKEGQNARIGFDDLIVLPSEALA